MNASPDHPPMTVQESLNLAVQHHTAGRRAEAESIYKKILAADPDQPIALHLLGVIALQSGDNDGAVDLITKAVNLEPNFAAAHSNLGTALKGLSRFDEAVVSYQKALSYNSEFTDAHYNLGITFGALERYNDAIICYQKVVALNPIFTDAHVKLGNTYEILGRLLDAAESYKNARLIDPDAVDLLFKLGKILQSLGQQNEAVDCYQSVLVLQPNNAIALFNLGKLFHELGQIESAIEVTEKGININPNVAEAHNNLGWVFQDIGDMGRALECYQQALLVDPNFSMAHYNIANLFQHQNKLTEATSSYQKALAINPFFLLAHNNLGVVLKDVGQLDEAIVHFERAIEIDVSYVDAYYNLCEILEKTNNTEYLRTTVIKAKLNCELDPRLAYREAQLLKRDGDNKAARAVLEQHGEIENNSSFNAARAQVLGDLCDRLNDAETAFSYFELSNKWRRTTSGENGANAENYLAGMTVSENCFTSEWVSTWHEIDVGNEQPDPVFLVGFPRSGTTLMDTILRSHQAIHVVEEGPAVSLMQKTARALLRNYPSDLARLTAEQHKEIRKVYFAALADPENAVSSSTIVIDKMPLNLVEAGLIHRIFPNARFLFAQRHPCDCVLSCFMQDFDLNSAMANFLSLQGSAHLYNKAMSLWQQYQTVLPLRVHTIRYESLVEGIDETLGPVLDFLGLDWDEGMRNYAETARQRKLISTPSYNQVTQPLYTRSRYRWKRYGPQMEPVLPLLRPWIKAYGYEE